MAGLTLVELLITIAVIVILITILVPVLQRVRRDAAGVVCGSNLRQWALAYAAYTDDYDGRFWRTYERETERPGFWVAQLASHYKGSPDLLLCPLAARSETRIAKFALKTEEYGETGDTFAAWSLWYYYSRGEGPMYAGGYAHNHFAMDNSGNVGGRTADHPESFYWQSRPARDAARIPLLTDGAWVEATHIDPNCPPPGEENVAAFRSQTFDSCINRHDGGINGLFVDSHVAKISLKELWTLKWHRDFDTAGPWTKAGGVRPEDWPKWLRRLKD